MGVGRWIAGLCLSGLLQLVPVVADGQSSAAVEQLLQQARALNEKGRTERAVAAYQKVLRSEPANVEALRQLGEWHAKNGRRGEAQEYLTRLKQAPGGEEAYKQVRAALAVGKAYGSLLQQARDAVAAGQLDDAVGLYRKSFGGAQPPPSLALEFYQTLGGTRDGWDEAKEGLGRYASEHPQNAQAQLAYAQHLTYRESARRQGIARLQELLHERAVAGAAQKSLRQALLWLNAKPADASSYRDFLEHVPGDLRVREKLNRLSVRGARGRVGEHVAAGYAALDRNELDVARQHFGKVSDSPEGTTGLALIAMREDDFERAEALLEGLSTTAAQRRDLWEEPLKTARFWKIVKRAQEAARLGQYGPAEADLLSATEMPVDDAHIARIILARVLQEQGEFVRAEQQLKIVLAKRPKDEEALAALVGLHMARGEPQLAAETNQRLIELGSERALPADGLAAEGLRQRALQERQKGRLEVAARLLTEAVARAPDSYWVRYDLANVFLETGDLRGARKEADALAEIDAAHPNGRVLRARLEAQAGQYRAALELLSGLKDSDGDGQVGELRRVLTVQRDVADVVRRHRSLGTHGARRALTGIARQVEGESALMAVVALGFADVGEFQRAVSLLQEALAVQPSHNLGLVLQLAAIYLRAGQDDDLQQILQELVADPELSPRQRRDVGRLRIAYAVTRADRLVAAGEQRSALLLLQPLLAEFPDDSNLLCGLGRLFLAMGEFAEARAIFERVLEQDAADPQALEGAVLAAQALQDGAAARQLLDTALRELPRNPRMRLLAARYELQQNRDDAAAMEHLVAARGLLDGSTTTVAASGPRPRVVSDSTAALVRRAAARVKAEEAAPLQAEERLADEIEREIRRIRQRHSLRAQGRPAVRYRAGEQGLGNLVELELPVGLSIPLGYFGSLELGAKVVQLTAGRAELDDTNVAARFGSLGAVSATTQPRDQNDLGVALLSAFTFKDLVRVEIGTLPLGFLFDGFIGKLQVKDTVGDVRWSLHVEREPVTDSMLSYAGTTDPVTGQTWGGVTAQGGGADLSLGDDAFYVYAGGSFHLLLGHEVQNNYRTRASLGAAWLLYDWDAHRVRLGLSGFGMAFAEESSRFTLGHGGYFSPQWFARGSVPVSWSVERERISGGLEVDPGINWFRRQAADYFPTDSTLQAQAAEQGLTNRYGSTTNLGFSLNVRGQVNYQVASFVDAGGEASMHFANDYEEYRLGVLLRFSFQRRIQHADVD